MVRTPNAYSPDSLDAMSLDSKFDSIDSPEDIGKIYDEIIDHIVELITNPFGNYLF